MTRLFSQAGEKIVLEKDNAVWMVRSPLRTKQIRPESDVDDPNSRKGISMDVLVDETEQDAYGQTHQRHRGRFKNRF